MVSLSVCSQSRIMKEEHPSTVTTVRFEGGDLGAAVTLTSLRSSSGKKFKDDVMEQGSSALLPVW